MLVAKKEAIQYFNDDYKKNTNNNKKRKSKENVLAKVRIFMFACTMLAVSLVLLLRYAHMTQVRYELTQLDNTIITLQEHRDELVLEHEKIKNTSKIEQTAKERLGMIYPKEDQIVYLHVDEGIFDNTESTNAMEKFSIIKTFDNALSRIASLF